MPFSLPQLPYGYDSLSPALSRETLEFHHSKHHQTYVDNLNKLIQGTEFEGLSLEEVIRSTPKGPIFNNAAQVWNHAFYFDGITPSGTQLPEGKLKEMIVSVWEDEAILKKEFLQMAVSNFGSGWTWLVKDSASGKLRIVNTSNADTPIASSEESLTPLLTCDVWEHAYYIDYRNRRAEYLENYWNIINWELIASRCA